MVVHSRHSPLRLCVVPNSSLQVFMPQKLCQGLKDQYSAQPLMCHRWLLPVDEEGGVWGGLVGFCWRSWVFVCVWVRKGEDTFSGVLLAFGGKKGRRTRFPDPQISHLPGSGGGKSAGAREDSPSRGEQEWQDLQCRWIEGKGWHE